MNIQKVIIQMMKVVVITIMIEVCLEYKKKEKHPSQTERSLA